MLVAMKKIVLENIVNIDYSLVSKILSKFVKDYLERYEYRGYVVGVSGGLDSAVALLLALKSVGRDRVLALIIPDLSVTPSDDIDDAIEFVNMLGIEYHIIEVSRVTETIKRLLPIYEDDAKDKLPLGNLRARLRMGILYFYANKLKYLVLGSTDRSEYLIGYFTKHGDGASDIAPLATLYKTQVRKFAEYLGIPHKIIKKPSSPRLWPNHIAEDELGAKYEDIDLVLASYIDFGLSENDIPKATGVNKTIVDKVLGMYKSSHHKRMGMIVPEHILIKIKSMIIKNNMDVIGKKLNMSID